MNVDVRCPACRAYFSVPTTVLGKRTKCTKCGERFEMTAAPASEPDLSGFDDIVIEEEPTAATRTTSVPPPPLASPRLESGFDHAESTEIVPLSSVAPTRTGSRKFLALRIVAGFYEIMAAITAVIAIVILALEIFVVLTDDVPTSNTETLWQGLVATALTAFWMAMTVTGLLFVAQIIRLALQVEANTFESCEACRRIASLLKSGSRQ